ncbi:hypothetical protein KCU95_g4100, partial [Aureobasidium melanogenum]
MADMSEMVVEEQQTVELAIVVDATHEAVEEKDPVTEQPIVVLASVVQDDDVPIELQDMMVKVAVLLEHELEDVEAVFEVELCELDSTLLVESYYQKFCLSSTYGHSQLKTGHPVRSAIHKQLNGRLVLRWVTTWESLLL